MLVRYDPSQPRDSDGKWSDGIPGPSAGMSWSEVIDLYGPEYDEATASDFTVAVFERGDFTLFYENEHGRHEAVRELDAASATELADRLDEFADAAEDYELDDGEEPSESAFDYQHVGDDSDALVGHDTEGQVMVAVSKSGEYVPDMDQVGNDKADQFWLSPDDARDLAQALRDMVDRYDEINAEAERSRKRGDGVESIVRKFNPGQARDGDGKWTDGAPGSSATKARIRGLDGAVLNLTASDGELSLAIPFGDSAHFDPDEDEQLGVDANAFDALTLNADSSRDLPGELEALDDMVKAYIPKVKAADRAFTEAEQKYGEGSPEYLAAQDAWFELAGDGQRIAGGQLDAKAGELHYEAIHRDVPYVQIALKPPNADDDWSIHDAVADLAGIELTMAQFRKLRRELDQLLGTETSRARSPESGQTAPASNAPKGGQFAVGGGRVGAKGKRPAQPRKRAGSAPAKPQGPMSFDGKHGTGYGIKGGDPRVRTLQSALNRLGLTDKNGKPLAVDGKYGPLTTSAVKKLQQALGVKADGQVTPELLKQVTALKQLPQKPTRPRRRTSNSAAKATSTRARILLAHVNRALRQGVEVRSQTPWFRSFALDDIQISRSGDGRTVEAYAAMFDQPYEVRDQHGHYNEVIDRAAFNRTLSNGAGKSAMCLYNHGMSVVDGKPDPMAQIPIGTPLEIRADGRGLLTVTRYNKSPYADEILEAIRNGAIRSQSFRGRIMRSSPDRVPLRGRGGGLPTITRHELGLTDYGPTPIPVNAAAAIMAVRSKTELLQDFAALDDDDRLELLRTLGVELDGADDEEDTASEDEDLHDEVEEVEADDDTPTSADAELGAEDPPASTSVKALRSAADITRRIRAEMIRRGIA